MQNYIIKHCFHPLVDYFKIFFRGLSEDFILKLISSLEPYYQQGEIDIIKKGTVPKGLYLIAQGEIQVKCTLKN